MSVPMGRFRREKKISLGGLRHSETASSKGCFGFRSLFEFNNALIGKWLWKFMRDQNSFWKRVKANLA